MSETRPRERFDPRMASHPVGVGDGWSFWCFIETSWDDWNGSSHRRESLTMDQEANPTVKGRALRAGPAAMALVIGLAALTATASESDLVRDIQRYCTVCWRNARLDPGVWDDCTQEVCCRLLGKARAGQLDLNLVLADDTPERRELVRAIDMVRKRVQRSKRYRRNPRSRPPRGAVASTGPDRRALDPRLDRSRDFGIAWNARPSRQRRKIQGAPEAGKPPGRASRRA